MVCVLALRGQEPAHHRVVPRRELDDDARAEAAQPVDELADRDVPRDREVVEQGEAERQLGAPALWLLPVTFPMLMAVGGVAGLLGLPLPGIEVGIAASAILLGLAVTSALRPPLAIAVALVAGFAVFHGHAHGTELPAGDNALLYSMGFVVATGCLHGVGIAIGLVQRWPWGQTLLRAAGAVIALTGVVFLWRAIA